MALGKSVRLFLADGTPGGLITAEIMNWTGHVIVAPRSDLAVLLKRSEVGRTGIYLLLGDDPDSPGSTLAYIGEGDDVSRRLTAHARSEDAGGRDFWNRAVVLTSKDMNLTKAHARYLESRFMTLAAEARRARLVNGTAPPPVQLPESDRSDMEYFIDQAKIVLPVLGINVLRSTTSVTYQQGGNATATETSPVLRMVSTKAAVDATAQEVDGEFTVRSGSRARRVWVGGDHNYRKLRLQLEQDNTLVLLADGSAMEFTRDQVFASPSAAAACVLGRNSNGRLEWKVADTRMTFGEWQESLLDAITDDTPERE
jgi:hypothetical protein